MALKKASISNEVEEYLEVIYKLERKSGFAKTLEVAKQLRLSPGSVTNTIESLEKRNLIVHELYRGVKLTDKGKKIALAVIKKHRLSERLLTDVLGMDWSQVHKAACKLEHSISEEVLKLLEKVLGYPETCPHGNPIPIESKEAFEEELELLLNLKLGERGTVEEYLEAIYKLEERKGSAKTGDLAKELNVTLGTITNTIEKMEKQKLITHKPYKGVKLTKKGRKIALDVIRRHRLSERLLTDILRLEWSKVHDAACKLEHAIADKDVIKPLEEALGKPKTCPHGNPIPLESGKIIEEKCELLADLGRGEEGMIVKVTDERPELLQYLSTLGLMPGANVRIEEKAPFNGPIMVKVMGGSYALGRNVASVIWIKRYAKEG